MQNDQPEITTEVQQNPSKKRLLITAAVVGSLVVIVLGVWLFVRTLPQALSPEAAADRLYEVLGNASRRQTLEIAMHRATYANAADADAKRNVGSQLSSVSGLKTDTGQYRSVFAHNLFDKPKFDIGRCQDGDTYNDNYTDTSQRPDSLAEANADLKNRVFKITQPLVFIPCPQLGLMPGATPDLAVARLSDGMFPVTLSQPQSEVWVDKVKTADLFDITDEGIAEHGGAQLRKFSFAPKEGVADSNRRLYDIFYESAEIDKLKSEKPNGVWAFGFIGINPGITGGIGGYYLVDESTNLPVYSELYGTNPDKNSNDSEAAKFNVARTKQEYSYPQQLTITTETPLRLLE